MQLLAKLGKDTSSRSLSEDFGFLPVVWDRWWFKPANVVMQIAYRQNPHRKSLHRRIQAAGSRASIAVRSVKPTSMTAKACWKLTIIPSVSSGYRGLMNQMLTAADKQLTQVLDDDQLWSADELLDITKGQSRLQSASGCAG